MRDTWWKCVSWLPRKFRIFLITASPLGVVLWMLTGSFVIEDFSGSLLICYCTIRLSLLLFWNQFTSTFSFTNGFASCFELFYRDDLGLAWVSAARNWYCSWSGRRRCDSNQDQTVSESYAYWCHCGGHSQQQLNAYCRLFRAASDF